MIRPRPKSAQRPNPASRRALLRAALGTAGILCAVAAAMPASAAPRRGIFPAPRVVAAGIAGVPKRPLAAQRLLARTPGLATAYPMQIDSYPRQGQTRVPQNATLYIAFDRPTLKVATLSVADLDDPMGGLLSLQALQWSAAGDTVFIRPLLPMQFGHQHGMKLNTVQGTDSSFAPDGLYPVVYFRVIARASLRPVAAQAENATRSLAPGVPTPLGVWVEEAAGTGADFSSASVTFLDASGAVLDSLVRQVSIRVPRNGVSDLELPVTLPRSIAAAAPGGRLSVRLAFYGTDETRSPVTYVATLPVVAASSIASTAVVESAVLEWPLPGAAIAAGDTLLPRAVVTGSGTGSFRAAFWLDGEVLSIEEGFLDAGRPAVVVMPGPIPTRRLGEHRLQFVVETPQSVAARPVSFLCVPPLHGVSAGSPPAGGAGGSGGNTLASPGTAAPAVARRLTASATLLGTGQSKFREQDGSGVAWGVGSARYDLGRGAALEANGAFRLRADDASNGSARPEQVRVRLMAPRGSLEWSDAAPALADSATLFMSAVPRRAAQGRYAAGALGEVKGYMSLDARPTSAAGSVNGTSPDLYAARITHAFAGGRAEVSAYGGYAHVDWSGVNPDSAANADAALAAGTLPRSSHSVYGGLARVPLYRDWTLVGEGATVRYRDVAGVQSGHSRTGWRARLTGAVAGIRTVMQGFRYAPGMATQLNPYALSNRVGGAAEASRGVGAWRFFAGFRSEQPSERVGLVPVVRVDEWRAGGTLSLNACSWVTPAFVRITHHGAGTAYVENRLQGELTRCEPNHGQTTARLAAATYRDPQAANARRRVLSGSVVSTVRGTAGTTSTLTLGYEEDVHEDLDKTDRTIAGTFETRWEAVPGRFLITPYLTGSSRNFEAEGTKETRLGGRLQLAWARFANLGENALALTGRLERVKTQLPQTSTNTDTGVELTWGQRFDW